MIGNTFYLKGLFLNINTMIKIRKEPVSFNETGTDVISSRYIIEIPLSQDMIQDCFMYYAIDAPTENKRMLMEILGEEIDKIILQEAQETNTDLDWLKNKLAQVKVTI